jgi:TrmH family RNA methyltransferase
MATIVSPHNPRLKSLRRLRSRRERDRRRQFVAEGEDLIEAAARAGWTPLYGFRLAGTGLGGDDFDDVERSALGDVSSLGSGTRVAAVYEQRWSEPAGPLCVYLHALGDPGNVGTVLRAAEAFGASSVALGPDCADPHSAKAVRASMGAIFSVPLAHASDPAALPGVSVALSASGGEELAAVCAVVSGPLTLLVGSEREGLPPALLAGAEHVARIPIASDSLNAAMAATVALYELSRGAAGREHDARRTSRVRAS